MENIICMCMFVCVCVCACLCVCVCVCVHVHQTGFVLTTQSNKAHVAFNPRADAPPQAQAVLTFTEESVCVCVEVLAPFQTNLLCPPPPPPPTPTPPLRLPVYTILCQHIFTLSSSTPV